jgi:uncharacterized protein (TIGR00299 family) protein
MFLACLVDAGWKIEQLRDVLERLGIAGQCAVTARPVMRGPFRATLVDVEAGHTHHHRHLHDIREMIENADLAANVKENAIATFVRLAEAEAKVHGTSIEKIHFHEVGALDAIVDIVGTCTGVAELGIERLYASSVPLGEGWVNSAHGKIPLPAPATLELLAAKGAPTRPAPGPGELLTPTGAALLAQLATFTQPSMRMTRVAYGAGHKELDWPNVARLWIGDESGNRGAIVQIDTNIDDMNPQLYGPLGERLFDAGALDVWLTPVQMKKGRPGVVVSVLAPAEKEAALVDVVLRQSTTLGVRVTDVRRHEAGREMRKVETPYGTIAVKLKYVGMDCVGATPEYEECRCAAAERGVPTKTVLDAAQIAANNEFTS